VILRRIIDHFRNQEWTAIALDFAIVVLGVFIGMQVSNWNADRAATRLGEDYARRLTRDTQENLANVQAQLAYYTAVLESVHRADALLNDADADPRALVVSAYRATEISYTAPVRATWDQVISSGHLGLLPKGAAETGLSQYYAFDSAQDVYRDSLNSGYRKVVRQIIPMEMQVAIRDTCSDVRDDLANIVGFMDTCELDVDPAELRAVAEALRRDPAVASTLRYQYSISVSATLNLAGVERSLQNALDALGAPTRRKAAPE